MKRNKIKHKGIEGFWGQISIYTIMAVVVILVMLPLLVTVLNSLKTNYELLKGVWVLPKTPQWQNWTVALSNMSLNMINSIVVGLMVTALTLLLGTVSAFVFVRFKFFGKNVIFAFIIALMVIPGVISLTPSYLLILNLNIQNTWLALIFPYVAGGQVGAIFLFRTFMSQQPEELFEAARIDGASALVMYISLAIPLSIPIIAIQAVGSFGAIYNDFLWPSLVISDQSKQLLMPILRTMTSSVVSQSDKAGVMDAMFLLSGVPLVFTTVFGLKYFINGDFASGLKL